MALKTEDMVRHVLGEPWAVEDGAWLYPWDRVRYRAQPEPGADCDGEVDDDYVTPFMDSLRTRIGAEHPIHVEVATLATTKLQPNPDLDYECSEGLHAGECANDCETCEKTVRTGPALVEVSMLEAFGWVRVAFGS